DITVNGTGNVNLSQKQFPKDTVIELTAQRSASGWRFVGWSGDVSGNDSTISVTMSVDRNITATFEKIPVPDNVYCVNSSAEGSRTGTNWADAFTTIDEALEAEENSATVNTVWVAGGEYSPSGSSYSPQSNCIIKGGFSGMEDNLNDAEKRKWYKNKTILDGTGKAFLINLGTNSGISIEGFYFENSYTCAIRSLRSGNTIKKCIFKNNGRSKAGTSAVLVGAGDSTKILNCVFVNNKGRGSCINVYTSAKHTIIGNCILFKNDGPAIINSTTSTESLTRIINCSIISNKCDTVYAGGIRNNGNMILENSIVYFNESINPEEGTQISSTNYTNYCNIQDTANGAGIGQKEESGFKATNISDDPDFVSMNQPDDDTVWFDSTSNTHALVPGVLSTSKSNFGLSESSEPSKYVVFDIRGKFRLIPYFMGAYNR
ncbi:MAG TPA: hypothetical protein VKY57_03640, partial [Chitinispirillaceae bacterium]|nr:hypothetical protein [Chitinispirillaceae bacterium]